MNTEFFKEKTKSIIGISKKLFNSTTFSNICKFCFYLVVAVFMLMNTKFLYDSAVANNLKNMFQVEHEYVIYRSMSELHMHATKEKCVNNIQHYIDSVAPNSSLNAIEVLDACEEYNIDIVFVLAQAQLESHFGTTGVAYKTNSVWNVMAYDGRTAEDMNRNGHGFKHPDYSIRPYLQLLCNNYLGEEKTEYDLLRKFESLQGKRYASDKNYEKKLTDIYNRMMESTNIFDDYQEYKKYKLILNVKQ